MVSPQLLSHSVPSNLIFPGGVSTLWRAQPRWKAEAGGGPELDCEIVAPRRGPGGPGERLVLSAESAAVYKSCVSYIVTARSELPGKH